MAGAPWVAITTSIDPGRRLRVGVPYLYTPRSYATAVSGAGGVPVLLAPGAVDAAAETLSRCDALVLSGGDQLPTEFSSTRLGEARAPARDPQRDPEEGERIAWERALIDVAAARAIPILGVCYGMQLLNLHFGGSLRAEFLPESAHHGGSGEVTTHEIEAQASSRVFRWVGPRAVVASSHHQAIDRIAPDFQIAATALDGVVEAIEAPEHPIVGIEWHPELDATGAAIYGGLVDAARRGGGAR